MPKNIPFGRPILGDEEKAAVANVLSGTMLTHGPQCKAFEERFADLVGVKHAVTTSNCTTALQLSLMGLNVGPGDEVVVPAMTHVATAHAVEHLRAKPVFADVEKTTGNISPEAVGKVLSDKTKAVIPVHYLGLPCDMDRLKDICGAIPMVEDCALAVGAEYDGKKPGSLGLTGCFSFYPAKHMTTLEGGMLTTNDDEMAEVVRKLRAFGYDKGLGERAEPGVYDIVALGHNFRMSEAHAAVGLCQLDRLPGFMEARRRNSDRLFEGLSDLERIEIFPMSEGKSSSGRYCFNITLKEDSGLVRREVSAALNEAGIGTSVHYPVALPLTTYYKTRYEYGADEFPVAQWIADNTISLPCGPHLTTDDVDYIIETAKAILG